MHGTYAANMAISESDLIIGVGVRFDDRATGKLDQFAPDAKIIHIDIDSAAIARNVPVEIPIVGDAKPILRELTSLITDLPSQTEWQEKVFGMEKSLPPDMSGFTGGEDPHSPGGGSAGSRGGH